MSSAPAHDDSERLIRHLRRRRTRVVQRRRRRKLLGGAAALAIALGSAVGIAGLTGTDLAGAAATRAESLMDLLDKRSPGERTEGQLTKTKVRRHALADHLEAAPAQGPIELAQLIAPPPALVPADVSAAPAELAFLAPPQPPGSIFFPPPGGGGGGPPGGGGGGTPGGPGSPPGSPPIIPPALPEPGTWLTMLAGFGCIGWALRRQRSRLASFAQ
jgi:hypothetical protein